MLNVPRHLVLLRGNVAFRALPGAIKAPWPAPAIDCSRSAPSAARMGARAHLPVDAEHRAEIAPTRLSRASAAETWGEAMAAMLVHIKEGRCALHDRRGRHFGAVLAEHFPRAGTQRVSGRLIRYRAGVERPFPRCRGSRRANGRRSQASARALGIRCPDRQHPRRGDPGDRRRDSDSWSTYACRLGVSASSCRRHRRR